MQPQIKISFGAVVLSLCLGFFPSCLHAGEAIEGKVITQNVGKISSEITGERAIRVEELPVRVGDQVKKGDLLARLSTSQLSSDKTVAQRLLEEAEATVGVAEADLVGAKLVFDRQAGLTKSDAFRRADYEDAEVALRAAESELNRAKANVDRRKAEVERIQLEIDLANIVAPYDGIVVRILSNVGASVTQLNPNILELLDLSRAEIQLEVPPNKLSHFQIGRLLSYEVENGEKYSAKVRTILPNLSEGKNTKLVRLELKKDDVPSVYSGQQLVKVYLENEARSPE